METIYVSACVLILCVEPFAHGPLEVISLSAFVLCVEPFGCGHQVWLAQYCMLSHFFGHRGDLMAFVICVKASLIWHGLQSSEEIVRGPAL